MLASSVGGYKRSGLIQFELSVLQTQRRSTRDDWETETVTELADSFGDLSRNQLWQYGLS